jgi:hypothetical protein
MASDDPNDREPLLWSHEFESLFDQGGNLNL